uniref:F-box protein At1g20360-like n=1 Tax=Nicotiana sylvestris TaxID=4096 RepID=A0A1U7WR24_NICSY
MNDTFSYLALHIKPVYAHHSLHWLRSDDRLLAFDLEREEATILDFPEFISHHHVYD